MIPAVRRAYRFRFSSASDAEERGKLRECDTRREGARAAKAPRKLPARFRAALFVAGRRRTLNTAAKRRIMSRDARARRADGTIRFRAITFQPSPAIGRSERLG